MPTYPNNDISVVRERLRNGMVGFMQASDGDCDYTSADIDRCMNIVDAYLSRLAGVSNASQLAIRDAIRQAVLDLNVLSEKCESLIETDQREELCELILVAAKQAGLDSDEDVTEEWRMW